MLEIFGTNGYKSCWIVNQAQTRTSATAGVPRLCIAEPVLCTRLEATAFATGVECGENADSPQVPQLPSRPSQVSVTQAKVRGSQGCLILNYLSLILTS